MHQLSFVVEPPPKADVCRTLDDDLGRIQQDLSC